MNNWSRGGIIGRGSYAVVSSAVSSTSGDIFAVKSTGFSQSQSLQKEQRILSSLTHPNIVSYIGHEITTVNHEVVYNLLMELLPGGSLSDEIARKGGRLEECAISCYSRQILMGLDYIHSIGITHCDLKAENILIGEDGVKISDFGCAKMMGMGMGMADELIGGTPMFMAPEVASGKEQGFPSDIWALGCTVIEMVTGGPPWSNVVDPVSVLYKIGFSKELPVIPDDLSCNGRDFLEKCLRRDPKERWTARELLRHPFLDFEFEFGKVKAKLPSISPTSILDEALWNNSSSSSTTVEEVSEENLVMDGLSSPANRIRRLSLCCSRVVVLPDDDDDDDWSREESWTTIRDHNI